MKVILLQDIAKVGRKYDEKKVADGHALNFLIPRGLAEVATEKSIKRAELRRNEEVAHRKIQEDLLSKNIASLKDVVLTVSEKTNEKGHLFAGIHKEQIAELIKKQTNLSVPVDCIILPKPIKEVGDHDIEIKVGDKTASIKLTISSK